MKCVYELALLGLALVGIAPDLDSKVDQGGDGQGSQQGGGDEGGHGSTCKKRVGLALCMQVGFLCKLRRFIGTDARTPPSSCEKRNVSAIDQPHALDTREAVASGAPLVLAVLGLRRQTQIAETVVCWVAVDMVNQAAGPASVGNRPSEAMSLSPLSIHGQNDVAPGIYGSSWITNTVLTECAIGPEELPRAGAVAQASKEVRRMSSHGGSGLLGGGVGAGLQSSERLVVRSGQFQNGLAELERRLTTRLVLQIGDRGLPCVAQPADLGEAQAASLKVGNE